VTAVGQVIDYLFNGITALPACQKPVSVHDGWPGTFTSQQMVTVGGGPEDDEQSTNRDFALMGQGPRGLQEQFEVLVYIRAWQGGDRSQKATRDQALAIYQAIEDFIVSDMNLGGALSRDYPAHIGQMDLNQTKATDAKAGRVTEIRFTVNCTNRYAS
jgi:hypothetical protein